MNEFPALFADGNVMQWDWFVAPVDLHNQTAIGPINALALE